jgi:ABC-type lipoprotein release transport system permease subunit
MLQIGLVAMGPITIGALASTYPALRANRLDPHEAIRSGQN